MILSNEMTSQCIVIAGNPLGFTTKIKQLLSHKGFENLRLASNGEEVYDIVRSMAEFPDQLGIIIIHQELHDCQVHELCKQFSCDGHPLDIPFVVIGKEGSEWQAKHGLSEDSLVYNIYESYANTELIAVVELLLTLKSYRIAEAKQREQLMNELADRKILDAKVKYLSEHDALTGLLTRSSFETQLAVILQRNNAIHRNGCLLLIDLDRFGLVNELEGFDEGDRLIVEVVTLIRQTLREDYLFSRQAYGEYAIYIDQVSEAAANFIAERILMALTRFRFLSGTSTYTLAATIGQAMVTSELALSHPEELISRARQAGELARLMDRNHVCQYDFNDPRIKQNNNDILWLPVIRSALQEDRFFLEFQPIIDINTGKIWSYEVLVRLLTETNEVIYSEVFIPIAERFGLIGAIDMMVIDKTIHFLSELADEMAAISFAINLSSQSLNDESLFPIINQLFESFSVNPGRLYFEITETTMIQNLEQARRVIMDIRSLGCHFALDDFGFGFNSFHYLRIFPVEYLKFNQQLIETLETNETDRILVQSLCDMARKLQLKIIVKHIELPERLTTAKKLGINLGQGFLFASPEPGIKEHVALNFLS